MSQPKPSLPPRNLRRLSLVAQALTKPAPLLRVHARSRAGRHHLLLPRYPHRRARNRALLLLRESEADGVRHGRELLGGDRLALSAGKLIGTQGDRRQSLLRGFLACHTLCKARLITGVPAGWFGC